MALTAARINAAVATAVVDFDYIQLHTGDPGAAGTANVATQVAGRLAATWSAPTGGVSTASVTFAVTVAGGPFTHISGWSAATSGTHQGNATLTPAETFTAAGDLAVTVTATGTGT